MQQIQREQKTGASQSQIATRLMQKGVTMQQLQRVRSQYENLNGGKSTRSSGNNSDVLVEDSRLRDNNGAILTDSAGNVLFTQQVKATSATDVTREKIKKAELDDNTYNGKMVFGRDIFNKKALSFEPNMNIATPTSYVVGPGDKVFIDVYGASQKSEQLQVSPDGTVQATGYGPIHIAGLTVAQANARIKETLGTRYKSSEIRLTVGQTRTISVNIMGEVAAPGTYTLSAFATVFHALYMAGGVNGIGTLRNIKVFRGGRQVTSVDLYDYILNGKLTGNVRLADNDVIMVGPFDCIVDITGYVKRPMAYEMKKNESVATLLKYAGGFASGAYRKAVRVNRVAGDHYSAYNVPEFEMAGFKLADGDSVTVDSIMARYENTVTVEGAVFHPGHYDLGSNPTVRTLVQSAGGVTEVAFLGRAVLHRMKSDRTWSVLSVDLEGVLNGTSADVPLENEDILTIALRQDKSNARAVTIIGEVMVPGPYEYAENETIEDLIIQAGGLTDAASTARVDVSRRIIDPKAMTYSKEIAKTFSFTLKDGLLIDGDRSFTLMPYDEVMVRRSPGFMPQRNIMVEGEVLFAGCYTLNKKNLRLTDAIKMAGGVTDQAYVRGARIERPLNEDEKFRLEHLLKMAQVQGGSGLDASKMGQDTVYYVGIELDKALANPGSDYDVVLREGDRLVVPEYSGTVKINGNVMHPNTVAYMEGKPYKWYINKAGGYGNGAKRSKAYILYQNGLVSKVSKGKIEPGCEIIVPNKTRSANQNIAMIASLGTSLATMVTMIATVTNLIKSF